MIRRPPRATLSSSSAASDVYKRQVQIGRLPIVEPAFGIGFIEHRLQHHVGICPREIEDWGCKLTHWRQDALTFRGIAGVNDGSDDGWLPPELFWEGWT